MGRSAFAGLVLAAGVGTRISVLSRFRPKPLLPVGTTTPLARATEILRRAGAERVVANAAHLPEQLVAAALSLDVAVVVEQEGPRGTAGGLAAARDILDADEVAIWNGDVIADVDVGELRAALKNAGASLAVRGHEAVGGGNVGIDACGRVVRLRGRTFPATSTAIGPAIGPAVGPEVHGAWFAAVQAMRRELVDRAPTRGCLIADLYFPFLAEGGTVLAVPYGGRWHDVGDLPSYLAANIDLLDGEHASIGNRAVVASTVSLDRCVLGAGAVLDGSGIAREVVMWPWSRATAPLARAVVIDKGNVVHLPS